MATVNEKYIGFSQGGSSEKREGERVEEGGKGNNEWDAIFKFVPPQDLLTFCEVSKGMKERASLKFKDNLASYFNDTTGVLIRPSFTFEQTREWYLKWRKDVLTFEISL